eukprot:scaffold759_cov181-Pinguiococcus_pyrenoidosus.AAC.1
MRTSRAKNSGKIRRPRRVVAPKPPERRAVAAVSGCHAERPRRVGTSHVCVFPRGPSAARTASPCPAPCPPPRERDMRTGRVVAYGVVPGAASLGLLRLWRGDELDGAVDGYRRAVVTIGHTLVVAADYSWTLRSLEGQQYAEEKKKWDERAAQRLLDVCLQHGGCYTKLGQHLSTFNHLLPRPFTDKLSVLQNKAKARPFGQIEKTIQQELGRPYTEVFHALEPEPLAAASLAQVHRGKLLSGEEVCIKVQYPHLRRQVQYDLFVLEQLVRLLAAFFPEFDLQWLLPEARRALFKELDFAQEGRNADISRKLLKRWIDVGLLRIPEIRWELTSERLLTMELVEVDCKINDAEQIRDMGFEPVDVADRLTKIFASMIFGPGWVHVDPHPGNVWIRRTRPEDSHPFRKRPYQIVLFDHGSYFNFSDDFRTKFRELWRAMMLMDADRILEAGEGLGAGEFSQFFPLIFTYRPIFSKKRLGFQGVTSEEDRKRLREEVAKYKKEDWTRFMQALPTDMLFLMRVNDMMRSINKDLGGTTRLRLNNMGDAAVYGYVEERYHRSATAGTLASTAEEGESEHEAGMLESGSLPIAHSTIPRTSSLSYFEQAVVAVDAAAEVLTFRFRMWLTDLYLRFFEILTGIRVPVLEPDAPGEAPSPRRPHKGQPGGMQYLEKKLDGKNQGLRIG